MSMHQRWRKISGNLGTYTSLQWLVRTQGLFRLICAVLLSSYQKVFKLKKRKKEEEVANACTPEQEPFSDLSFPFRGWHYLWNAFKVVQITDMKKPNYFLIKKLRYASCLGLCVRYRSHAVVSSISPVLQMNMICDSQRVLTYEQKQMLFGSSWCCNVFGRFLFIYLF